MGSTISYTGETRMRENKNNVKLAHHMSETTQIRHLGETLENDDKHQVLVYLHKW